MGAIATNSNLFHGNEDCRVPAPNVAELEKHTYEYVGQMIAVSLVHGGPSPVFLAPSVVDYIVHGMSKVKATASEVPSRRIGSTLEEVSIIIIVHAARDMLLIAPPPHLPCESMYEIRACDVHNYVPVFPPGLQQTGWEGVVWAWSMGVSKHSLAHMKGFGEKQTGWSTLQIDAGGKHCMCPVIVRESALQVFILYWFCSSAMHKQCLK